MTLPPPRPRPPYAAVISTLAATAILGLVVSLWLGSTRIPVTNVLASLGTLIGRQPNIPESELRILLNLRLPRSLVGFAAGALVATATVALQGGLRNRLAEPATAGTAAGALFGATMGLVFTGAAQFGFAAGTLPDLALRIILAAVMALLATRLVVITASDQGRVAPGPLLLGGLAVSAFVGSLAAAGLFLGSIGTQTAATVATIWIFGGVLAATTPSLVNPLWGLAVLTVASGWVLSRPLDQMLLGEDVAQSTGVDVRRTRLLALVLASVATASAVAVAGVVAFAGLIAATALARFVGPDHRRLFPAAAVLGGTLVMLLDAIGRHVAAPAELPVGVITAAVGAPLLLFLLRRELQGGPA